MSPDTHDALSTEEGYRLFNLPEFTLPTPGRAFLMSAPKLECDGPMSIAQTWVDTDQMTPDQERHARGWGQLIDASPL